MPYSKGSRSVARDPAVVVKIELDHRSGTGGRLFRVTSPMPDAPLIEPAPPWRRHSPLALIVLAPARRSRAIGEPSSHPRKSADCNLATTGWLRDGAESSQSSDTGIREQQLTLRPQHFREPRLLPLTAAGGLRDGSPISRGQSPIRCDVGESLRPCRARRASPPRTPRGHTFCRCRPELPTYTGHLI